MKNLLYIFSAISLPLLIIIAASCARFEEPLPDSDQKNIAVKLSLVIPQPDVVVSRSNLDELMSYIDNVHVLLFGLGVDGIPDTNDDSIVYRTYFEYGVEQKIYLKTNTTYRIYIVANLDASNTNIGDASTFFDDVNTLGDLRNKYIIASSRSVEQMGKMVMTSNGVVPVNLPNMVDNNEVTLKIPISRLNAKIIFNIYNRVVSATDKTIASGVYPVSWSAVNIPKSSYLMMRSESDPGEHDYPMTVADPSTQFSQSQSQLLAPAEATIISYNSKFYIKQTFSMFVFENRRGDGTDITDVKQRKEKAPTYSTYAQITANTAGNVIAHYINVGKGAIDNYDLDRSCIYYMNVYINSPNEINEDSRRQFLDQLVLFTFPDVSRIDAHYLDIPTFISGMNGYVKLQSGTCDVDTQGNPIVDGNGTPQNLVLMDTYPVANDEARWLRMSFFNPFRQSAGTSQYVGLSSVDAISGATPILHFREFIDNPGTGQGVDPKKRTAVIRVGYVPGAHSVAEYDAGVLLGQETFFFTYVSQYGLKTVGSAGGFDGEQYTSLLGVESAEENLFPYYPFGADVANLGPYWKYKEAQAYHNQVFDGKTATTDHYNDFRAPYAGGVPPARGGTILVPIDTYGNVYNPSYNTNAADYCMRKNRDEDGDGIILGDEIKWYLPTPAQLMQVSIWRDSLKYSFDPQTSFNTVYWTTNEHGLQEAYGLDFFSTFESSFVGNVFTYTKVTRNRVRCVRDITGSASSSLIYKTGDYLAINMTGSVPGPMLGNKTGQSDNFIRSGAGNSVVQQNFIMSRWYVTNGNDHTAAPLLGGPGCELYSEPGYPAGSWELPSQRELSFIYAYSGLIENFLSASFPGINTYHNFNLVYHWAATNTGNNATYWSIDFLTGYSATRSKKNTGYNRCIQYLGAPLTPTP